MTRIAWPWAEPGRRGPCESAAGESFGPHVARERLALARDAGADDVVSRGELLGGFAGLLRRWQDAG